MPDTSFTNHVADYFKARPLIWITAVALESVGGRQAWRTRVSNCRKDLGMDIRNRQQRMTDSEGKPWCLSEYCYFPPAETVPDAPHGHDLNAWSLS